MHTQDSVKNLQRLHRSSVKVRITQESRKKRRTLYINNTLHRKDDILFLASAELTSLWLTGLTTRANHSNGNVLIDGCGLAHPEAAGSAD